MGLPSYHTFHIVTWGYLVDMFAFSHTRKTTIQIFGSGYTSYVR